VNEDKQGHCRIQNIEEGMENLRIGFCLLVPGARDELDVHAVPVYLV
jgi:hypothetical protein